METLSLITAAEGAETRVWVFNCLGARKISCPHAICNVLPAPILIPGVIIAQEPVAKNIYDRLEGINQALQFHKHEAQEEKMEPAAKYRTHWGLLPA